MSLSRYERVRLVLHVMLGLGVVSWGAMAAARERAHLRECVHVFLVS